MENGLVGILQRMELTGSCEAGSREATATTTTTTLEGAARKTENVGLRASGLEI